MMGSTAGAIIILWDTASALRDNGEHSIAGKDPYTYLWQYRPMLLAGKKVV